MRRVLVPCLLAVLLAQGPTLAAGPGVPASLSPAEGPLGLGWPALAALPPALAWGELAAVDTAQAAPPRPQVQRRLSRRREEGMRLTRGVGLGAAVALSSGLLAWWSQERADRAYDRYLRSAGIRRQERYFARSEDYDRVAGVAFAGMELGLVLVTYHLFF